MPSLMLSILNAVTEWFCWSCSFIQAGWLFVFSSTATSRLHVIYLLKAYFIFAVWRHATGTRLGE